MKLKSIKLNPDGKISGESAFLYKTSYGIPVEILKLKTGRKVDIEEYNKLFEEHRKISQKSAEKLFKEIEP